MEKAIQYCAVNREVCFAWKLVAQLQGLSSDCKVVFTETLEQLVKQTHILGLGEVVTGVDL